MKTVFNYYLATFYFEPSLDLDGDMQRVELYRAKTMKAADKKSLEVYNANPNFKSYGIEKQNFNIKNRNCHCAVNSKDAFMTFDKAVVWFNEQVKAGENNIRVWFMLDEDNEELVLYKGNLPY